MEARCGWYEGLYGKTPETPHHGFLMVLPLCGPGSLPLMALGTSGPAVLPHKAVLRTEQGFQAGNSDVSGGAFHLGPPQVRGFLSNVIDSCLLSSLAL